jgi:uncharacterized protein
MLTPQNLVSDRPPFRTLIRIVMVVVLGFVIIGPILGLAVSSAFYQGDLLNDLQSTNIQPGFLQAILTMQGIVTLVGLIILPAIYLTRLEHKPLSPFFPRQQQILLILLIVAGIGVTFPISISPLAEWNMNIKFPEFMSGFERWAMQEEERLAKLTSAITDFKSTEELLLGILVIALLPAIGEELVFRGMIQHELWRSTLNIHLAIWISAGIFSAIHMQFYGFIPRLLLGALFGYLYYWSGNLLIPMFSHFFNNAFAVIMVYLNHLEITDVNMEDGEAAPVQYVVIGLLLTLAFIYYIWKHYREFPPTGDEAHKDSINQQVL